MEGAVLMGDGRVCMWPAITVSEALEGLHKACNYKWCGFVKMPSFLDTE
jgi:hypothetical protein